MNIRKNHFLLLCVALCCVLMLSSCTPAYAAPQTNDEAGFSLQITATLFPQYDFTRRIAGDAAQVQLLIPPGVESHSFDPTPSDMVTLINSDLLIYTGPEMETWVAGMLSGLEKTRVVDLSVGMPLGGPAEPEEEHNHTSGDDHAAHAYDPHIWTSPVMAGQMAQQIRDALCEADPANAAQYTENAAELLRELSELDTELREIVSTLPRRELVFGSRFASFYFAREYGLSYLSPYASCSGESEPAARTITEVIDQIREEKIPVIFYQELSETKVCETIAEATGAKMLLFHSCHNVSRDEFQSGATYLSLMRQNAQNLREALQ